MKKNKDYKLHIKLSTGERIDEVITEKQMDFIIEAIQNQRKHIDFDSINKRMYCVFSNHIVAIEIHKISI